MALSVIGDARAWQPAQSVFAHFTQAGPTITGRMPDQSMQPKIDEGDLLQIEPCERIRSGGFTYAFEINGEQFVRVLDLRMDGDVDILALNPRWLPDRIPAGDLHKLRLVGRVVGVLQYRRVV